MSIPFPRPAGPCLSSDLPLSLSRPLCSLSKAGEGMGAAGLLCIPVGCWEELESFFLLFLF